MIHIQKRLLNAEQAIDELINGESVLAACVLRGEAGLSTFRLLAADVFLLDDAELWYELLAARHVDDSNRMSFVLHAVSDMQLPTGMTFILHFGEYTHELRLDDGGSAAWSLPLDHVLDARTRRIRTPILLSLASST
jgi:hypothetical protein